MPWVIRDGVPRAAHNGQDIRRRQVGVRGPRKAQVSHPTNAGGGYRPICKPSGVCEKGGDGVQPMRAGGEGEVVVVEVVVPDHDLVVAPLRSSDATREQPVPLCGSPGLTHCGPAARARTCASARAPPRGVESLPSASGARRASSRPGSRPRRRVSSTPPSSDAKLGGHLEKVVGREGQGATPAGPPRVTVPDLLA